MSTQQEEEHVVPEEAQHQEAQEEVQAAAPLPAVTVTPVRSSSPHKHHSPAQHTPQSEPYNLHTHHHVPHHDEDGEGEGEGVFQDRESDGEGERDGEGEGEGGTPQRRGRNLHRHHGSPYSQDRRYSAAGPSDALLRSTAARHWEKKAWDIHLEEKRTMSSPMPIKKPDPNYVPGEGLLKTTQSRIHERRQWEEIVKNKEYADDIWWEKRKPAPVVHHKNTVPPRLHEPTVAALHGKREKFQIKKENERSRIEAPSPDRYAHVAPINAHSPLLKITTAYINLQVDKEGNLLHPPEEMRHEPQTMPSKLSGPQVASKLMHKTRAFNSGKWVEKKPEEKVLSPRLLATMRPPSARLLEFNTAMKAQSRDKATKSEKDKREQGWNSYHHKDKIPDELPAFTPTLRWSRSPGGSPNRSRSLENGHMFDGAQNEEYYDEGEYYEEEGEGLEGDDEFYDDEGEQLDADEEALIAEADAELAAEEQAKKEAQLASLEAEEEHVAEEASPVQEVEEVTNDNAGSNVDSEAPEAEAPAAVEQDLQVVEAALEKTTLEVTAEDNSEAAPEQ